jgi:hypothetical protein
MWIGATTQYVPNTWTWYNGQSIGYTSWAVNQPSFSKRIKRKKSWFLYISKLIIYCADTRWTVSMSSQVGGQIPE